MKNAVALAEEAIHEKTQDVYVSINGCACACDTRDQSAFWELLRIYSERITRATLQTEQD